MNFSLFKQAVAKQFAFMQKYPLFAVDIDGDTLWDTYLRSFPEGTNEEYGPIFSDSRADRALVC